MEIEFKFNIPPDRLPALQAAVCKGRHARVRMEARYFDTPDGALAARGIALRLRREGAQWVQTVKALGQGPLDREEHNVDRGPAAPSQPAPDPLPELHAGSVAGARLHQALREANGPLAETYGTEMDRVVRRLRMPGGMAELALDTGQVVARRGTAQQTQARICELELELLSGPVEGLAALAVQWAARHGLSLSTVSKAERGERLLAAQAEAPPATKAAPWQRAAPHHRPWLHGPALLRAVVAHCLHQILGNASELAEGRGGEEHQHQLRIGIRRLRTALRHLAPLAPDRLDPAWAPALVDAFQRLGQLRDQSQALQSMAAQLQAAGAPALDLPASAAPPCTQANAADIVRTPAFQAALIGLMALTAQAEGPQAADDAGAPDAKATRRALQKSLRRLHAQVSRDARGFAALPTEQQHRLRKRLKRLRYLAEFVAPAMDGQAEAFLASLQPALAALGRLNDERVAQAVYADLAAAQPAAWFAVGWLAARQNATAAACELALGQIAELPKLRKAHKPR